MKNLFQELWMWCTLSSSSMLRCVPLHYVPFILSHAHAVPFTASPFILSHNQFVSYISFPAFSSQTNFVLWNLVPSFFCLIYYVSAQFVPTPSYMIRWLWRKTREKKETFTLRSLLPHNSFCLCYFTKWFYSYDSMGVILKFWGVKEEIGCLRVRVRVRVRVRGWRDECGCDTSLVILTYPPSPVILIFNIEDRSTWQGGGWVRGCSGWE
jgi:hypothetical protein